MPEPIVLDVRADLREGREPLHKIMAAAGALAPGQELVIISSFEPRPLYQVLGGIGLAYRTEEIEDGAWRVTVFQPGGPSCVSQGRSYGRGGPGSDLAPGLQDEGL